MSALVLEIAGAPLEAIAADLAVVPCFADDRPLVGAAGRADWRLCGALSRLVQGGWVRGEAGEAVLVPSLGGITAPRVMALGLGPRNDFDAAALARFASEALRRASLLHAHSLALGWPERLRISHDEQSEALLAGAAEAGGAETGLTRVWLCASASEAAALAQSLRGRGDALPPGLALAAALAGAELKSPARPAEPFAPSIARIRIK
ncbi:MAG TPA: M17 family peptidase N-terminal domain-containing protein [Myxococcota bacterium]|nr:M17 family peptidase N-terminal domain-containing protein [Myxococcota bacterium]